MSYIPIIDLGKVRSNEIPPENDSAWILLAQEIRKALGSVGFMQLINHGIPSTLVESVFQQSKLFFSLDEETKKKYAKPRVAEMSSWYGYTSPGQENSYFDKEAVFEFRETYDWLEGKGVYPDEKLPKLNSTVNQLHERCKGVAKKVLRLWAIGLGLGDVDYFVRKNQHWVQPDKFTGLTNMKIAHYPPFPEDLELPESSVRIGEHTDLNTVSFVFQDETGGLEVKSANGWIKVPYIPEAIVCNTGDLMEFWTKGLFEATPHRIPIPKTETEKRKARYSILYFCGPDQNEVVKPLEIVLTPEEKEKVRKVGKHYSDQPLVAADYILSKLKNPAEDTQTSFETEESDKIELKYPESVRGLVADYSWVVSILMLYIIIMGNVVFVFRP